ncbi:MAG: hypothetical protein WKG07_01790 [Hymenobacter sp.]
MPLLSSFHLPPGGLAGQWPPANYRGQRAAPVPEVRDQRDASGTARR